ncbi:MAG: aldolase/citrate lyase family protein [Halapricum sp.]
MDQHNAFRDTIENGGSVLGARCATFEPTVIELYGELGLDWVWLDFEHTGPSPYDSTRFEELTRAAEVGGIELVVRIPSGRPPLIRKVLDAGVRNLLVPRIDTVAEVREAVEATRFVYDGNPGERGMSSGRSSAWGHATDYTATEDREVCLGVMIEKTTAISNLDEILSVPGLGFVFVGPADLSVQMGHPGELAVQEQIREVFETSRAAGVPVGRIAHDPDEAGRAIRDGYQIVRIGGELESMQAELGTRLDQVRDRA